MPAYDFKSPRLFVAADLAEGSPVALDPAQANYLMNVMRLETGASVLAFNGRDGEWRCQLERAGKKKADLLPEALLRAQTPPSQLAYLFAPLKHARLDYMVQKAVEMGAGILQPVMTQHVQSSRVNVERMQANAIEAAEQCGILTIAECREPMKFDAALAAYLPHGPMIFCDEREDAQSPAATLAALPRGPLSLLIGPEGGFSAEERDRLRAEGGVTAIALGPRILRADTAAVAALAIVQAVIGDW
ncbi:16S rRNA (uracil(1498)-N(3))-methyltransferase [Jiella sp. MQZ9-1]|uniref:Ribosomal RNA small subunit methyltransferase E n=1 Tax=Jiella flava TaxID=2816857 RepID=A0A939JU77_9HYPH|nr:16S rRNA (uracil(1498)-N(3))-methyltransferase [Jiella flava]MBO0661144.1 16S rRNA (uracil(1498)-N(3))-methyltransferase [Jiella flava]MCD2469790.1 16S rRNA (uracil(1498)-N(3))-methyltransferase [Jiella flava]